MQEKVQQSTPPSKLSETKHKYYTLCKQIRGIESRIFHLEAADSAHKKKLELLQKKNQSLERMRQQKRDRENSKMKFADTITKNIEESKTKNMEFKRQHSELLNDIVTNINEERRTRYAEIKNEKQKNEEKIKKIKESYLMEKRRKRDKIVQGEKATQFKIKQFYKQRQQDLRLKLEQENMTYSRGIDDLEQRAQHLENQEKSLLESVKNTNAFSNEAKTKYFSLTGTLRPR